MACRPNIPYPRRATTGVAPTFGVLTIVLSEQSARVLVAVYNVGYLDTVIVWEVEDDVSSVGNGVTTQSFRE